MKTIKEYSSQNILRFFSYGDTTMFDGCIVSKGTMQSGYSPLFRLDECFILLCVEGEIRMELNEQEYTLLSHSLFVCPPNMTLQMECRKNSTFICLIPTSDYLGRHYNYWKQILPLMLETRGRNMIPLTAIEVSRYEHISSCVLDYMCYESSPGWPQDALSYGLKMLLCLIFAKIKDFMGYVDEEQEKKSISRSEEYFSRFMKLLAIHFKQERKVDFYASQLCVTPKYLSSMVKKESGKTPSKWIDEVVMEEIGYLLRYSTSSIKEIAYQMNFSNISFFGKFVKRYTGVSPHHYRHVSAYNKVTVKVVKPPMT